MVTTVLQDASEGLMIIPSNPKERDVWTIYETDILASQVLRTDSVTLPLRHVQLVSPTKCLRPTQGLPPRGRQGAFLG